jgi:hypothetical protein
MGLIIAQRHGIITHLILLTMRLPNKARWRFSWYQPTWLETSCRCSMAIYKQPEAEYASPFHLTTKAEASL